MRIMINGYFITYTDKLKSASLSNFPLSTKFLICNDWHLHIPKPKLEVSKNESLHNGIDTPKIRCVNEGKVKVDSKQSEADR